jgi:4-hydroxybenzoate polyprenyltransferase
MLTFCGAAKCISLQRFCLSLSRLLTFAAGASASSTDPLPVPAVLKLFAFMNAMLRLLCGGLTDRVRTRHTHYTRHLSRLTMQVGLECLL